jgi:hypothetical protein
MSELTPRKSTRVSKPVERYSPDAVTDPHETSLENLLNFAIKSRKEDFLVKYYFEHSNQEFRDVVGRAHSYFSLQSKSFKYPTVAETTEIPYILSKKLKLFGMLMGWDAMGVVIYRLIVPVLFVELSVPAVIYSTVELSVPAVNDNVFVSHFIADGSTVEECNLIDYCLYQILILLLQLQLIFNPLHLRQTMYLLTSVKMNLMKIFIPKMKLLPLTLKKM